MQENCRSLVETDCYFCGSENKTQNVAKETDYLYNTSYHSLDCLELPLRYLCGKILVVYLK